MTEAVEIPIFPLNTVLYPGGRLPLRIFETRYVDMTKRCIADDTVFGVCTIREGREAGVPAQPERLGCTARIVHWDVPGAGLFALVTEGERVFRILEHSSAKDGLLRAFVQFEPEPASLPLPDNYRALARFVDELIDKLGAEHFGEKRLDDSAWVSHRAAEILPMGKTQKLRVLEARDPLDKLREIETAIRLLDSR